MYVTSQEMATRQLYTMIENAWPIISYVSLHDNIEDVIFVHINRVVTVENIVVHNKPKDGPVI